MNAADRLDPTALLLAAGRVAFVASSPITTTTKKG